MMMSLLTLGNGGGHVRGVDLFLVRLANGVVDAAEKMILGQIRIHSCCCDGRFEMF